MDPKHLIWNNHDYHISMAFRELLQSKSLTDVTIVCGDKSIPAHKLVLSAASPFFHRLIEENPCKNPIIILNDYPSWIIEFILAFVYCGEIHIPHEAIFAFVNIAKELQINGLNFATEVKSPMISPSSTSSQPRRKQPKPHRLSEQENAIQAMAPLDFSIKSSVTSTSNVTTDDMEPCVKRAKADNNGGDEHRMHTETLVAVKAKAAGPILRAKLNETDILSLPYPNVQSFNAKIPLDGLSPDPEYAKKEKFTPNATQEPIPYNKDFPFNIQRQHQSARGGPPRSWTNQDLLNALDDVWSKRMNTSQAARYHRIPYNSLLMYVRGKYGKTLNIKLNEERAAMPTTPAKSAISPQMMSATTTTPGDIFGDESKLRQLFSQSFPQQACLPPNDLLHNFAVLSKAASQHNIK